MKIWGSSQSFIKKQTYLQPHAEGKMIFQKLRVKEANHPKGLDIWTCKGSSHCFLHFLLLNSTCTRVPTAQDILDAIKIFFYMTFTYILILSFSNMWLKRWYCSWDVANTAAPLFLQDPHFNLYIPELPHT